MNLEQILINREQVIFDFKKSVQISEIELREAMRLYSFNGSSSTAYFKGKKLKVGVIVISGIYKIYHVGGTSVDSTYYLQKR